MKCIHCGAENADDSRICIQCGELLEQPDEPAEHLPNAQLKALKKVRLRPGEAQQVRLSLPLRAFGLYDAQARLIVHPGRFLVYAGTHGPDRRSAELTGGAPVCRTVTSARRRVLEGEA